MSHANSNATLVALNIFWLRQAIDLLDRLDDRQFTASPGKLAPHRVSGHLRHIIEFYECFLEGLQTTHVDYDARKRDPALESSIAASRERLEEIIARLQTDPALFYDNVLFVRMEDAEVLELTDPYLLSSVGRELMTLSSHTIHHFALIGVTLRAHDVALDPDFGMAPSTIRYRENRKGGSFAAQAA